jgi:hypothetical protein
MGHGAVVPGLLREAAAGFLAGGDFDVVGFFFHCA